MRLAPEPATDRVDDYGRLLRHVIRARDSVNVNLRLVARGAAAPYYERLEDWAGVENLEERVDGEDAVDPIVLRRLRERSNQARSSVYSIGEVS